MDDHSHHGHAGAMNAGHGDDHSGHVARYRRLFWIMLVLSIPVVVYSHGFMMLVGYSLPQGLFGPWVSPVVGTVMYFWGGWPFLSGAGGEIRRRKPGMMLLVALAITVAFLASWASTIGLADSALDFWWELALLIVIMLLGHWLEMRSVAQTSSALQSLAALLPDTAERVSDDDTVTDVPTSQLREGDLVVVRPGGRVPADGVVERGEADVDESMITGEAKPVLRTVGSKLVAGTVSTNNALRVRITAVGNDTALAGIQRLVASAQNSSTRTQRLADRSAAWLFWFALGASAITTIVWSALVGIDAAIIPAITVLVIACPHALGLAIPLVVSISTEIGAKNGILIKDRLALEAMRTIDTVFFDKTGTLTKGAPVLSDIATASGQTSDNILALAASAEADSEHPFASALRKAATARGLEIPAASQFTSIPGTGVTASVETKKVSVGGPSILDDTVEPLAPTQEWAKKGSTTLHILIDGTMAGAFRLDDEIRPESYQAVKTLHEQGIRVTMVTGDTASVAQRVASALNIDDVVAGVRPENKAQHITEQEQRGHRVAMVGDGVNDAPALASATVGIAIGAGTDVAIASAGVILASSDPRLVAAIRELSRASYSKMRQNLWWAAGYNIVAIPLAAGVLAPIGFILPMAVGAFLMSASTVVVAVNAQLLRRLKPGAAASLAPQVS